MGRLERLKRRNDPSVSSILREGRKKDTRPTEKQFHANAQLEHFDDNFRVTCIRTRTQFIGDTYQARVTLYESVRPTLYMHLPGVTSGFLVESLHGNKMGFIYTTRPIPNGSGKGLSNRMLWWGKYIGRAMHTSIPYSNQYAQASPGKEREEILDDFLLHLSDQGIYPPVPMDARQTTV